MARKSDPLGLGKLQRRIEGPRTPQPHYVVEIKPERPRGLFGGFRGTLVLLGAVVVVLVAVSLAGSPPG